MTSTPFAAGIAVLLASAIGFAAWRGSICSVVAAHQIVEKGRLERLVGFLLAAAVALALTMPLAWWLGSVVRQSPHHTVTASVIAGGALYGLGAWTNRACAFGTLVRIAGGETSFVAMLPGAVTGYWLAAQLPELAPRSQSGTDVWTASSFVQMSVWLLAVLFVGTAIWRWARQRHPSARRARAALVQTRWRQVPSMVIVGAAGGLLFALLGSWSYTALLRRVSAAFSGQPVVLPFEAIVGCLAMLAGAIAAAALSGRLRWSAPQPVQTIRSVLGGTLIGFGASLIPGGNDTLVLFALPGLALNGIVAYVAMFATLIPLVWLAARVRR